MSPPSTSAGRTRTASPSDGRAVKSAKVPTTEDPTDGVIHGLEMLAGKFDTDLAALLGACDRFVYGSTTATNIFVQRRLPKTGLLCTHGHRDILWFRGGNKPDRWNLRTPPPWSLLDRHLRRPIRERIDQTGDVMVPLEEQDVREAIDQLRDEGVEAVAIAFLWSFLNPAHERRAQAIAREQLGDGIPVLASIDILPVIREWERTFCTVLGAGIMVETRAHLESFRARMSELGLKGEPLVMQCNGGHAMIDAILRNPLPLVASGPAGGALAGVYYGELTDSADVMTIDTGGTSFDVCVLPGRSIPITRGKRLENEPIAIPSVDVHTIGAGGGSIAWLDAGGALRVGPQSAGRQSGPRLLRAGRGRADAHRCIRASRLYQPGLFPGRAHRAPTGACRPGHSRADRRTVRPRSHRRRRADRRDHEQPARGRHCGSSRSSAASTRAPTRCWWAAAPGRCKPVRSPAGSASPAWSCRAGRACSARRG